MALLLGILSFGSAMVVVVTDATEEKCLAEGAGCKESSDDTGFIQSRKEVRGGLEHEKYSNARYNGYQYSLHADPSQALVDYLNKLYIEGAPSNNASEIGVVLRTGLPDSWRYPVPRKNSLTVSALNWNISAPSTECPECEIMVYPTWNVGSTALSHAPVAIVYTPCAVDEANQCSYAISANTNDRVGSYRCARFNGTRWYDKGVLNTSVSVWSVSECGDCLNQAVLPEENNTVTGNTVRYVDGTTSDFEGGPYYQGAGSLPDMLTAELELLFNRFSSLTFEVASQYPCINCAIGLQMGDYASSGRFSADLMKFYEAPGYYGGLPGADQAQTQPKNELKDMLEYMIKIGNTQRVVNTLPDQDGGGYNELLLTTVMVDELERERSFNTDFSGRVNGECKAAVNALARICGKPGPCANLTDLYASMYGHDVTPPVIWMSLDNLTHPFSTSCDKPDPCDH